MSTVQQEDIKTAQVPEHPNEEANSDIQKDKEKILASTEKPNVSAKESSEEPKQMADNELENYLYEHISSIIDEKVTKMEQKDANLSLNSDLLHRDLTRQKKASIRYVKREDLPDYNQHEIKFSKEDVDPIKKILEVSVFLLLRNLGVESITHSALHDMTELAVLYMGMLFKDLHKYTEIQRRRKASKSDLCLLLKEGYFGLRDIVIEHKSSTDIDPGYKKYLQQLNHQAKACFEATAKAGDQTPVRDSPGYVFFHEQPRIVPSEKRKSYIPKWMPQLPPGYTYKSTPTYSKYMTDPKELRSKLIAEGRLGEKALHNIKIAVDGSESDKSVHSLTSEDESESESLESEQEENKQQIMNSLTEPEKTINDLKPDLSIADVSKNEHPDSTVQASCEEPLSTIAQSSSEKLSSTIKVQMGSEASDEKKTNSLSLKLKELGTKFQDPVNVLYSKESDLVSDGDVVGNFQQKNEENGDIKGLKAGNNTGFSKEIEKDKSFDIVKYAEKRLHILSERKKAEKMRLEKRKRSEEAVLGKYLGSYTQYEKFPDHYDDVLTQYYKEAFNEISRNFRHQKKRQLRRIEMEEAKRRKLDIESQNREKANSIEVGGFGENMDVNMDEDVDFEMEFSDAEAIDNDLQKQENDKTEEAEDLADSNVIDNHKIDESSTMQQETVDNMTSEAEKHTVGQVEKDKRDNNQNELNNNQVDDQNNSITDNPDDSMMNNQFQDDGDSDKQPSHDRPPQKKIKLSLKLRPPSEE